MMASAGTGRLPFTAVADNGDTTETSSLATFSSSVARTATPNGGLPPHTYLWSKVSGDAITIDTPSVFNTTFTATGLAHVETRVALFKCTVIDNNGAGTTVSTRNIQISLGRT